MNYLIYVVFFAVYGIYMARIGAENLSSKGKHLDVIANLDIMMIRLIKGQVAADNRRNDLLSDYKHKILSRSYLIYGLGSIIIAIGIFFDNI